MEPLNSTIGIRCSVLLFRERTVLLVRREPVSE